MSKLSNEQSLDLVDSPRKRKSAAFKTFADCVLQHRKPVNEIARDVGIHPNTLYNAINCRQEPSFELVVKILKVIGLEVKIEKTLDL